MTSLVILDAPLLASHLALVGIEIHLGLFHSEGLGNLTLTDTITVTYLQRHLIVASEGEDF